MSELEMLSALACFPRNYIDAFILVFSHQLGNVPFTGHQKSGTSWGQKGKMEKHNRGGTNTVRKYALGKKHRNEI